MQMINVITAQTAMKEKVTALQFFINVRLFVL